MEEYDECDMEPAIQANIASNMETNAGENMEKQYGRI